MSGNITVLDEDTGEVDYIYRPFVSSMRGSYSPYVLDYDQRDAFPWASQEVVTSDHGSGPAVDSVKITWDDGSVTERQVSYSGARIATRLSDNYAAYDAEGRLTSVVTFFERDPYAPRELRYSQTEYDVATGRVDYSYVVRMDGVIEARDYSTVSGLIDYAVTTFTDGRVVSQDYNAATGLLDYAYTDFGGGRTLAQDYDTQGRLDYAVERLADGRMIVTDYDLLDQQPWVSYSITYSAAGAIDGVTVL